MYEDEYKFSGESPMKECYEALIRLIVIIRAVEVFEEKRGHLPRYIVKWMDREVKENGKV